jgi:NTE family protein
LPPATHEPRDSARPRPAPRVALVLAGGAARGAYEVGVVRYLLEDLARTLGHPVNLDVLCGTSVGAINVCALAATADEPRARSQRLANAWSSLRMEDVLQPDGREIFRLARSALFRTPANDADGPRHGAVLDPTGLSRLIEAAIPFDAISDNLRAGHLAALTVSTTHVGSGRTVVFVQRREGSLPRWSRDPTVVPRAAKIRAEHALASAAIPLMFPAVRIDGEFHCDGGLRQNVPLSPARRLGASRLIVVNPRHVNGETEPVADPQPFPGPFFLLGKALNALLLDRIDNDIDRLKRITRILEAGTARYGPGFVDEINQTLGYGPGRALRPLHAVLVRASRDIGALAADFVRSSIFRARASGLLVRALARLGEGESAREADLLSYLLFDGEFAGQLMELGRADAAAQGEELRRLFDEEYRDDEADDVDEEPGG